MKFSKLEQSEHEKGLKKLAFRLPLSTRPVSRTTSPKINVREIAEELLFLTSTATITVQLITNHHVKLKKQKVTKIPATINVFLLVLVASVILQSFSKWICTKNEYSVVFCFYIYAVTCQEFECKSLFYFRIQVLTNDHQRMLKFLHCQEIR